MLQRQYRNNTSFLDLLFNLLIGVMLLFIISFLMVNERKKQEDTNLKTKAEYVITVTWEDGNPDDVDTWLEDPTGKKLSFKNKNIISAHLDRDDRGTKADKITLPDGREVEYIHNQELTTIRGIVEGEWTLNLHMYHKVFSPPTVVEVKMDKLNPSVKTVLMEKISLGKHWEQKTVARFVMSEQGNVVLWSKLPKQLVHGYKPS